jgi:phage-related protein
MSIFDDLFGWLTGFFKDLFVSLKNNWLYIFALACPAFAAMVIATEEIVSWIVEGARWLWTGAGNLIASLWASCVAFVNGAIEWLLEVAGKVIEFVADAIATVVGAVAEAIVGAFGGSALLIGALLLFLFISKKKEDPSTNITLETNDVADQDN